MANKRTFLLHGVTMNGVAVGGAASLGFDATYKDIIRSPADNVIGIAQVDRSGLRVPFTFDCADVTKVNQLLLASGATTFHAKQAGAANWHKYTITGATLVPTGMRLTLSKNDNPRLTISGLVAFTSGASSLDDVFILDDTVAAAPTRTEPVRIYRPYGASFDPDGAPGAIAPIHMESIELSLDAMVLEDYGDNDVAITSVNVKAWNTLQVTLRFRDATKIVTPDSHTAAKLADAIKGTLTANLLGLGGATAKVLTVNNLLFTGMSHKEAAEFTEFSLNGECGWIDGATAYQVNSGTKLFSFA